MQINVAPGDVEAQNVKQKAPSKFTTNINLGEIACLTLFLSFKLSLEHLMVLNRLQVSANVLLLSSLLIHNMLAMTSIK